MITAKLTTIEKRFINLVLTDEFDNVVSQGYVSDVDYKVGFKKVVLFTYINTEHFNFSFNVDRLEYDGLVILPYNQPLQIEELDDILTDEWVYPTSEAIYKYWYIKKEETLRIVFNSNKSTVWRYYGVEYEDYKNFHNAGSKGKHYTKYIRGDYESETED